ncbi:toprim domain-containing protein [Enterococcus lactis]|uniref:toprim domain-containing protein n=1 Tax=Enterococcus lactis TaxID=357441 RepID=UPI0039A64CCD
MSTVILAEKPSQALAYASALKQSTKKDGYFEIKDPLFTDETFITFGFGHLVELAEPGHYDEKWQNWKLESLPIFPDRYDFEVAKDKGKQFKIVAELLKKANTIIVATDSDREGVIATLSHYTCAVASGSFAKTVVQKGGGRLFKIVSETF